MAKNKDWKEGYEAAIEAIKQALANQNSGSGSGAGNNQQSQKDPRLQDPPVQNNQQQQSGGDSSKQRNSQSDQSGQDSQSSQGNQNGAKQGGQGGPGSSGQNNSRTSSNDANQGIVRPEDCAGPDSLSNVPGRAGGMIDRASGDDIVEQEGYDKMGAGEEATAKDWSQTAVRESEKNRGNIGGSLMSKIDQLYKVSTDWKKALRQVVGMSLNNETRRSAYANKNVLVSQDRIARTDKDKYDNVDYMCVFIDSSGSMSDDQLRLCLSEVYSVALAKKPITLFVIQCDTKIQDIKSYNNLRDLKRDMVHATVKGRGGTELKPCWDLLKNDRRFKGRRADLVMVFTDGYLTQYKRDPRTMTNLCWVILDNPSFNIQHKEISTKKINLSTKDIK